MKYTSPAYFAQPCYNTNPVALNTFLRMVSGDSRDIAFLCFFAWQAQALLLNFLSVLKAQCSNMLLAK
jgi:hypothetical protein